MCGDKSKDSPVSDKSHVDSSSSYTLILYNDEHNTIDHVITSLVDVCGHDEIQAEQCALIAHFKGSCEVKSGIFNVVNSMCGGLGDRDLTAEIKS